MKLDQALRSLTPKTFVTRKGGASVRLAVGAELAVYHRYVSFEGASVSTFDATSADLAATDWDSKALSAAESKPAKA
jgi:hypothetical protein